MSIPKSLSFLQRLSFFRYALEALLINEVSYLQLNDEKLGLPITVSGTLILERFGFAYDALSYRWDILNLFAMFVGFLGLGFAWLFFYVRERR